MIISWVKKNIKILVAVLFLLTLIPISVFAVDMNTVNPDVSLTKPATWFRYGFSLIYNLSIYTVAISSYVFDNLIAIGLSTHFFNLSFIKVTWSTVRDIANIGFIIGAIYVAFLLMKDSVKTAEWKKPLISLVMVVFVINFSLFFTRVVVDAGNLTARIFYTSISSKVTDTEEAGRRFGLAINFYDPGTEVTDFKSISGSFYQSLSIEKLVGGKDIFEIFKKEDSSSIVFIMLLMVATVMNIFLAFNFFKTSFVFIGRIVWIMIYMIASPLAFILLFLPTGNLKIDGKGVSFLDGWLKPLISKSFCMAIYLFIIWFALIILQSDFSGNLSVILENGSTDFADMIPILVGVIIKFVFIYMMLDIAYRTAKDTCDGGLMDKFGGALSKTAGGLGMVAKYTGAGALAGLAGRQLIGKSLGNSLVDGGSKWAKKGGVFGMAGNLGMAAGMKLENTKFGSKTYNEAYDERQKSELNRQKRMPNETREERKKNLMGIGGGLFGNDPVKYVKGFKKKKDNNVYEKGVKENEDEISKILNNDVTNNENKEKRLKKLGVNKNTISKLIKENNSGGANKELVGLAGKQGFLNSKLGKELIKNTNLEDISLTKEKPRKFLDFIFRSDAEERGRLHELSASINKQNEKKDGIKKEIVDIDMRAISEIKSEDRSIMNKKIKAKNLMKYYNASGVDDFVENYQKDLEKEFVKESDDFKKELKNDLDYLSNQMKETMSIDNEDDRNTMTESIMSEIDRLGSHKKDLIQSTAEAAKRDKQEDIEEITKQTQGERENKTSGKLGVGEKQDVNIQL